MTPVLIERVRKMLPDPVHTHDDSDAVMVVRALLKLHQGWDVRVSNRVEVVEDLQLIAPEDIERPVQVVQDGAPWQARS